MEVCRMAGCGRPVKIKSRQLCNLHYRRFQRHGDPEGGRTKLGEPLSYLESLVTAEEHDCIEWPYGRLASGHGSIEYRGGTMAASRAICIMAHGEPEGQETEAAHRCGHPSCVNPKHIYWATHRDNYFDRVDHYGGQRGERHGMSKLTAEKVLAMRADYAAGARVKDIAVRYCVSRQAVTDIMQGRRWQWLSQEPMPVDQ